MSKFHSVVNRREFMKGLGLTGASLSAIGATSPLFHDLDEVMSSDTARTKQPWWVKEVDKPTVEIDFKLTERYDQISRLIYYNQPKYVDPAEIADLTKQGQDNFKKHMAAGDPGQDIKGLALCEGGVFGWSSSHGDFPEYFLGDPFAKTPEEWGISKWQGTPEENSRIITAAAKLFGACITGFAQIQNEDFKKYFFIRGRDFEGPVIDDPSDARLGKSRPGNMLVSSGGGFSLVPAQYSFGTSASPIRELVFEDVDKPYSTDSKKVIPNSFKSVIVMAVPQDPYLTRLGPSAVPGDGRITGFAATGQSYGFLSIVQRRFQKFMKTLGYSCLGGGTGGLAPVTSWGVWSGLGEMNRMNPMLIPEWGTMIRSTIIFVSDIPIVPTKPIDAGMFRFCHTCRKCAEACPYQAISLENEPTWEAHNAANCSGAKKFFLKAENCMKHRLVMGKDWLGCDNCMSSCPFGEGSTSFIHAFVKSTLATTPVFDSFFYNMSKSFGYGHFADPEEWWHGDHAVGGPINTVGTRWHDSWT
ncbi:MULTISPECIES: reductive dehalogenase [Dehalococcoides]|uniref:reductive dehalogenase n=1 Tax=Dehalococcoides TaxID=61434 RepID=UPI0002B7673A|nr:MULTISPECIES: reductive dehalogenase [Dehalococcoides]AGG06960.1 reductive dehalogenase [Dehalococcoides mccartyi DCMB5]